jgi:hypothetical protein
MADEITAAGKRLLAEFGLGVEMAEHGISDVDGRGGKVGFIESAFQECARGQDDFACAGRQSESIGESEKGDSKDHVPRSGLHT